MTSACVTLDQLHINPDWAKLPLFDRKGWKRVRFGDVVENLNETERDPAGAGIERFIAMEHLEPGSLHIREWGNVADGTTFNRRCHPGQVLFGKRRAYQRKVAVAEFDAVVSGDIYVFSPKGDRLLPELLRFVCISEKFFKFAVETSAGSLSPRTNWTSLASFEFDLPPLDQQRHFAETLWRGDEALVAWKSASVQQAKSLGTFASLATLRGLQGEKTKETPIGSIPRSWNCASIDEMTIESAYGPRFPGSSYSLDGNVRQIRTTDFDRKGGINFAEVPSVKLDQVTISKHQLKPRDFLLSRSGEYAGLTAIFSDPGDGRAYIPGAFLIRYRLGDRMDPKFLLTLCDSEFGEKYVKPLATGSAQPNISGSAFSRLIVPIPPLAEQKEILNEVLALQRAGECLVQHYERTQKMLSGIGSLIT